jgi:hypothetical protein
MIAFSSLAQPLSILRSARLRIFLPASNSTLLRLRIWEAAGKLLDAGTQEKRPYSAKNGSAKMQRYRLQQCFDAVLSNLHTDTNREERRHDGEERNDN